METVKPGANVSGVRTDAKWIIQPPYKSSAWVSDKFTGEHARQIQEETLVFGMDQTHREGGLDVGFAMADAKAIPVSDVSEDFKICSTYDIALNGAGRWWAGPKISVNWQGIESAKGNGDDWYENYVVDLASSTSAELHDILTGDYFKGERLADTVQDGATYRHYKIRYQDWWQFWSVRQTYRETGTLSVRPILDVWIAAGLPEGRPFDGVKANIETYGALAGSGRMRAELSIDPQNPTEIDDCAL